MKKKNHLVLGLGIAGKAVVNQLLNLSCSVIAIDKKKDVLLQKNEVQDLIKKGLVLLKDEKDIIWENIEKIILSPGIVLSHPIVVKALNNNVSIIDEITFALSFLKNKIIGITGTNGKTTLTYLLEHIFVSSNRKAKALGNVGVALSSYISHFDEGEILFLELSSFQLEMLNKPFLDAAVILNISPDHLDRYKNFNEYAKAKINIQKCLKKEKKLFLSKKVHEQYHSYFDDDKTIVFERFYNKNIFDNLSYNKTIDIQTIMAAYCTCKYMNIEDDEIIKGLFSFVSLPHRLEYVTTIGGVNYYNDSKATNIFSVIHAVNTIKQPIILIVGGEDKDLDFSLWNKAFIRKVIYIIAIGRCAKKIEKQILTIPLFVKNSLEEAVKMAYKLARESENVLLSPGCSSYDMFDNYEHRGDVFKRIIFSMKKGVERDG